MGTMVIAALATFLILVLWRLPLSVLIPVLFGVCFLIALALWLLDRRGETLWHAEFQAWIARRQTGGR